MTQKSILVNHLRTPCCGDPPTFQNLDDAIQWAVDQGAFGGYKDAAFSWLDSIHPLPKIYQYPRWIELIGDRISHNRTKRTTPEPTP